MVRRHWRWTPGGEPRLRRASRALAALTTGTLAVAVLAANPAASQARPPLDITMSSSVPLCVPSPHGLLTTFSTRLIDTDGKPRAHVAALTFTNLTAACDGAYGFVVLLGNDAGDVTLPGAPIGRASSGLDNCTGEPVPAGRITGGEVTVALCPDPGPGGVVDVMNLVGIELALSPIPVPGSVTDVEVILGGPDDLDGERENGHPSDGTGKAILPNLGATEVKGTDFDQSDGLIPMTGAQVVRVVAGAIGAIVAGLFVLGIRRFTPVVE